MATIRERKNADGVTSYQVMIRIKGFPPETATFERKTDASKWAKKVEADMMAGRHFGAAKRYTFNDLANEYLPHAKDAERLRYWCEVFGTDSLDTITPQRIGKVRDTLLNEETNRFEGPETGDPEKDAQRPRAKRSGATTNRYLAALSSAMSYAVKTLQWLESNPCERIVKPKENKGRVRFLSDGELKVLLAACKPHNDLYLAVLLALSTGARQEEVMSLRYGQVDFTRQAITLTHTKNGDVRALPLTGEAFVMLKERSRVRSLHDDRVFPPSSRAHKAEYIDLRVHWEKALADSGIKDFHWHDLRHTAASYLAMSGVSMVEIAKLLGHRTMAMVLRYAHLSTDHTVEVGEKLSARLGI